MENQKIYTADKIFTGDAWLDNHAVITEHGLVKEIISLRALAGGIRVEAFGDCIIAPAFIDLQIYGAFGKLLAAYPDPDCLQRIRDYSNQGGACLALPTIATNTKACIYKCIDAVRAYWSAGGDGIAGLHIEGPWINSIKRGAHIESLIHAPSVDEVKELLEYGKGVIRMFTMAPEICSDKVIEMIRSNGIICSAGHSNASYEEAMKGFEQGFTMVTHLYNAMSPLQHRSPGMVGAAMDHDKVMASIIPDGHHADYAAIRVAMKIMKERLFVITDAVTETTEGYYRHYKKGDMYEADGILSGSALNMTSALQNLVSQAGVDLAEALRMCSLYPARVLELDKQYGKIETGYQAAWVVLDKNLALKALID